MRNETGVMPKRSLQLASIELNMMAESRETVTAVHATFQKVLYRFVLECLAE